MEIDQATTVNFSLAALIAACTGLVAVITGWVTLRMRVGRNEEENRRLDKRVSEHAEDTKHNNEKFSSDLRAMDQEYDQRVKKLEHWKQRQIGAASVSQDTDRILVKTAETKSDRYPAG